MISILKYGETPNSELFARSMPTVSVEETVAEILRGVKERGDAALREYAEKFDHVRLDSLTVSEEEMREMCAWIASLPGGRNIPLHVTRFFPRYHLQDRKPTDKRKLLRLCEIAGEILQYVYPGNI